MRRLRLAGAGTALLVMTACTGGGDPSTTESNGTSGPSTSASTDADLGVIEAAVAAFYSGDADRAAELFELTDRTDDEIRASLESGGRYLCSVHAAEEQPAEEMEEEGSA